MVIVIIAYFGFRVLDSRFRIPAFAGIAGMDENEPLLSSLRRQGS